MKRLTQGRVRYHQSELFTAETRRAQRQFESKEDSHETPFQTVRSVPCDQISVLLQSFFPQRSLRLYGSFLFE